MNKEEFEEYVGKEYKKILEKVTEVSLKKTREDKIKYLSERGYLIEPPTKKDQFQITFAWPNGKKDRMGLNLEMAYKLELLKEYEALEKEEILCNKCGGDMKRYHDEEKTDGSIYGLHDAKVSGGFLSDPLEDCIIYNFSMCENCLHEMFLEFKNPPKISSYLL